MIIDGAMSKTMQNIYKRYVGNLCHSNQLITNTISVHAEWNVNEFNLFNKIIEGMFVYIYVYGMNDILIDYKTILLCLECFV